MEHSLISNIAFSMRTYQKENNIKNECITNAQYLYDTLKQNSNINIKTKAVLVFSKNNEKNAAIFVGGHLILELDDETIIDPSYDVFCLKDKSYFYKIKDLVDMFYDKHLLKSKFDIKKLIDEHIYFTKLSDRINNGEFIVCDERHYNNQADYIEKLYTKHIIDLVPL